MKCLLKTAKGMSTVLHRFVNLNLVNSNFTEYKTCAFSRLQGKRKRINPVCYAITCGIPNNIWGMGLPDVMSAYKWRHMFQKLVPFCSFVRNKKKLIDVKKKKIDTVFIASTNVIKTP